MDPNYELEAEDMREHSQEAGFLCCDRVAHRNSEHTAHMNEMHGGNPWTVLNFTPAQMRKIEAHGQAEWVLRWAVRCQVTVHTHGSADPQPGRCEACDLAVNNPVYAYQDFGFRLP